MRFREAGPGDLDDLVALENAVFQTDRLTRRRFAAHVKSANADLIVACSSDGLAGYALVLSRRGSRIARLYSLAVARPWRRCGLGARLLAVAQSRATRNNAASLRLEVRADNPEAIRLYESRGYRRIGQKEDYYADGATALCYDLTLNSTAAPVLLPRRLGRAA